MVQALDRRCWQHQRSVLYARLAVRQKRFAEPKHCSRRAAATPTRVYVTDLERAFRETVRALVREELRAALAEQKPDDELLTTGQASTLAKVSVGSVRRWIRLGKLARHRIGRTLRISRAELQRLLR